MKVKYKCGFGHIQDKKGWCQTCWSKFGKSVPTSKNKQGGK